MLPVLTGRTFFATMQSESQLVQISIYHFK